MLPLVAPAYNAADRAAVAEAAAHLEDGEVYVARLEARLADHFGAVGAVATTSGTTALTLALMATRRDTFVEYPSYSCVALLNAIVGNRRVNGMVDNETYDPETMTYTARPAALAGTAAITVHTFGVLADFVQKHDGFVIEDWAMALGATPAVIRGSCAVVSLHSSKMVSSIHGGAVISNDRHLLDTLRDLNSYADACIADRLNPQPAFRARVNYKMSGLNAAVGLSQLDRLPQFVERRRTIATYYNHVLCDLVRCPVNAPSGSVFGRYVFGLDDRMSPVSFIREMEKHGVECGRGVYPALHSLLAAPDAPFPNTMRAIAETASLPVHPGLSDEEVEEVAQCAKVVLNAAVA